MGGRFRREGTYAYLWLIHVEVWQKTIRFCRAIILQLKNQNNHLDILLKCRFCFSGSAVGQNLEILGSQVLLLSQTKLGIARNRGPLSQQHISHLRSMLDDCALPGHTTRVFKSWPDDRNVLEWPSFHVAWESHISFIPWREMVFYTISNPESKTHRSQLRELLCM